MYVISRLPQENFTVAKLKLLLKRGMLAAWASSCNIRRTISPGTPHQEEHPHEKGSPRPQSVSEGKGREDKLQDFCTPKRKGLVMEECGNSSDRDLDHSIRETDALRRHGRHQGRKQNPPSIHLLHSLALPDTLNLKTHTQAPLMPYKSQL